MTQWDETERLIEKLRRIEALFAGASSAGERAAASVAKDRILNRLAEAVIKDPPVEYTFTFPNMWSRRLFAALLRRYGLSPYRYYRQRYTTVMVKVPQTFVDDVLWPEYQALNEALTSHLDALATEIISQAVNPNTEEAEERPGTAQLGGA